LYFSTISSSIPKTRYSGDFWNSSFFARFVVPVAAEREISELSRGCRQDFKELYELIEGESMAVLRGFDSGVFDRAITSPPYFNARAYAQWPNLYCYLYDMYRNAQEVFRTLDEGGIYAYNIFDYFDNERVITFSDMGRKRIPLGALLAHVLEQIGFELLTVMPWDKGDIQGKRGFNGGNYSPYYQSPFNCWEHVLIMRKPITDRSNSAAQLPSAVLGSTIRVKPVFKMVRGRNTYGHTAPFPEALVDALLEGLKAGTTVLDPYAGSATTARAAARHAAHGVPSAC
jgi:DNA modification methylase